MADNKHNHGPNREGSEPSKYCGHVITLQEQADNNGWTMSKVVGAEDMPRQTMGTRD